MAPWGFLLTGAGLVALILYLSVRINRRKTTADLVLRLAEAYRSRGQYHVALALYQVPAELGQNREEAREGIELAQAREPRPPVLDHVLVEAGVRALTGDRRRLQRVLTDRGVAVQLPPLGGPLEHEGHEGRGHQGHQGPQGHDG